MLPFTNNTARDEQPGFSSDPAGPSYGLAGPSSSLAGPSSDLAGSNNARIKVQQDIEFLRDRLAALKAQARPNMLLVDHYQAMLTSRESILEWLTEEDAGHG